MTIYKITNNITGKIYIGLLHMVGKTIETRLKEHGSKHSGLTIKEKFIKIIYLNIVRTNNG